MKKHKTKLEKLNRGPKGQSYKTLRKQLVQNISSYSKSYGRKITKQRLELLRKK